VLTSPQNPAMESGFTMQRIMPMWKYGKHRTNSDIDTWDKRNGMLCSSEQLLVVRILDTKSSYKGDNAPGVEKYRTTGPLVPEFFWVLRKYFPMQERKNCNNSHKRKIHTMTSEMQVQPS
jgi:hypothetical protein